jgi:hypothetical protein
VLLPVVAAQARTPVRRGQGLLDLLINRSLRAAFTAELALGFAMRQSLLLRADPVIQ